IIIRSAARRLQIERFVPVAGPGRAAGITIALVLFRLLSSPTASACDAAAVPEARTQPPAFGALATSVCETPDVVRLRILASGDVDPGSVEVRFLGRQ